VTSDEEEDDDKRFLPRDVGMQVLTSTLERVILSDAEEDEEEDEDEDEDDDDDATKKGFLLILWLASGCCSSLVCEPVTLVIFVAEAAVKYEGVSYVLKSTFKLMALNYFERTVVNTIDVVNYLFTTPRTLLQSATDLLIYVCLDVKVNRLADEVLRAKSNKHRIIEV
ncbi:hypothetical protein GQX74_002418, partial [Glossina fuscipes]